MNKKTICSSFIRTYDTIVTTYVAFSSCSKELKSDISGNNNNNHKTCHLICE